MQNSQEWTPAGEPPNYPIESVDKALRLLTLFSRHQVMRLTEISEMLDVGRSTAHRLVAMLQYHEFVEQEAATKAYRFGPALIEVGLAALRQLNISTHMRPFMERAVAELDETVQLSMRFGTDVLIVDAVEPDRAVRVAGQIGSKLPAHASAAGKALLSILPETHLEQIYPESALPRVTPATVRTRASLAKELERIRVRGFATERGETAVDVGSAAAAIRNPTGTIRVAISISSPLDRVTDEHFQRISETAARLGEEASRSLA